MNPAQTISGYPPLYVPAAGGIPEPLVTVHTSFSLQSSLSQWPMRPLTLTHTHDLEWEKIIRKMSSGLFWLCHKSIPQRFWISLDDCPLCGWVSLYFRSSPVLPHLLVALISAISAVGFHFRPWLFPLSLCLWGWDRVSAFPKNHFPGLILPFGLTVYVYTWIINQQCVTNQPLLYPGLSVQVIQVKFKLLLPKSWLCMLLPLLKRENWMW